MTDAGLLGLHMIQHIFLMNVVAPLLAIFTRRYLPSDLWRTWHWATAMQIALLWGWHTPPMMHQAMMSPVASAAMQLSLFSAALWFWAAVLTVPGRRRWQAVFALLITGKLFCLLGVLLIFARSDLYMTTLQDQQFGGLIMVVICPLTYVAAGVVITTRWFLELDVEAESHE